MKSFDVVAIGNGNIDLIFKVPRLPGNDDKVVGEKLVDQVGGTVANSACVMAQLGLKTASLSAVGTDCYGQAILADFQRFAVDTRFIDVIPGLSANMAIIFLDASGEKSLVYAPGNEPVVTKTQYEQALCSSHDMYTMPGNITRFRQFAAIAKEHDTRVIVDIEPHIASDSSKLGQILEYTDIAFFNLDGFITSTGKQPTESTMRALLEQYRLQVLVVTCGAQGALAVTSQQFEQHPGYDIPVVDTTGAGDTFNAAFIFALTARYGLRETLQFASAAAAINIGYLGARGMLATAEQVQQFIAVYTQNN